MALNPYDTRRGKMRSRVEATRRQFLLLVGSVGALGATLFGGIELLKFMFPAATLESPPQFKTAFTTSDLTGGGTLKVNVISDTANRVTVVLDSIGIYAVYLVCTHLGCTPNYVSDVTSGTGVTDSSETVAKHYTAEGSAISDSQWLGLPLPRQPLLHRLDQLLRTGSAPDGLGRHPGRPRTTTSW